MFAPPMVLSVTSFRGLACLFHPFSSLLQLFNTPILQKAHAERGGPHVHAVIFDMAEGLIKELDVDLQALVKR